MVVVSGLQGLLDRAGQDLGASGWHELPQHDVDAFADVTRDHQWIHVDPARAAASPFGGTIVHGYFTLALLPMLHAEVFTVADVAHGLNYGLDRVRFPAPAPVGSKIRAHVTLASAKEAGHGVQVKLETTVETDAGSKPVCVAESLVRYYDKKAAS
ncbi:3-hydroxyacyl-thioester dehydratase HtdZ [Amycolatopsis endophytica]|uniref:Acyl dehydratase n=1 Tax=Amycolatopsis endophytica TaxID=860233 RepID=A0A853B2H6_9PSEU|nr:MaoC family dehydratase [Amycolatopsis endophytica]NYI88846.1 acyl dehydratase [Amycolatopsis endophytica]